MKWLLKLLFSIYLVFVVIFFFLPVSLISKPIRYIKEKRGNVAGSYFSDVFPTKMSGWTFRSIRLYSHVGLFALVLLSPCLRLSRYLNKRLFEPQIGGYRATPNQIASIVISQILGNAKVTKTASENLNAEYLFVLQPTLMDSGPMTTDDEIMLGKRREEKIWGFPYISFFQVYYRKLRNKLSADEGLKHNFLDASRIFTDCKEQLFTDTCHLGDMGQHELADFLADEIFRRFK